MKNYKITVSYDGTRYKGWQVLKSTDATIQGKLQMVLSALAGHPVEVIGSGRTDAGVHAIGPEHPRHFRLIGGAIGCPSSPIGKRSPASPICSLL